ncbi:MAG TPA: IS3 family transposase, partial [Verrucomicrobiae bacterium]|nr:IS3 family transposase [Verrucomicrobiae bacterium]
MRKKIVSPAHRRQAARRVVAEGMCSGRAACRYLGLSRATFWYRARPPGPRHQRMLERLRELSERHPRYGYRRIAALLRREHSFGVRQQIWTPSAILSMP